MPDEPKKPIGGGGSGVQPPKKTLTTSKTYEKPKKPKKSD
jgi:hypothetical protein